MKVLNLYSGIGGNRRLWGDSHEITAIEYNPSIAKVYQANHPNDKVIVGDAHEYLLHNYLNFDFIWSSPPCQTWSKMNTTIVGKGQRGPLYPDITLYQEILFLQQWAKNIKWVVENVEPLYTPLVPPTKRLHRHLFWANFRIGSFELDGGRPSIEFDSTKTLGEKYGISDDFKTTVRKDQVMRNCVNPQTGLYILECAMDIIRKSNTKQTGLFE